MHLLRLGICFTLCAGLIARGVGSARCQAAEPAALPPPLRALQILESPDIPARLEKADGQPEFVFQVLLPQVEEAAPAAGAAPGEKQAQPEKPELPAAPKDVFEQRTVPASKLVAWGHPAQWRGDMVLLLADGGLLTGSQGVLDGDIAQLAGTRLTLITRLFDEIVLPLERVRGLVFQPPADPRGRDHLLDKLAGVQRTEDLVILVNGDELSGSIQSLSEGKLKLLRRGPAGKTELELTLATSGGTGQVAAVAFNAAPGENRTPQPVAPRTLVGFDDGTLLYAQQVWRTGEEVRLLLAGDIQILCERPEKLISLQPLGQGITYLSDLTPHSFRHVPYLALPQSYGVDRSVQGDRLRSGGELYSKGLGLPSASRLTYPLDKAYRKFEAELALDDEAGSQGSVVCRVYLHTAGQWQVAWESKVIRGGDQIVPVSLELKGATAITLVVDYADRGDELDLANWLNARLVE